MVVGLVQIKGGVPVDSPGSYSPLTSNFCSQKLIIVKDKCEKYCTIKTLVVVKLWSSMRCAYPSWHSNVWWWYVGGPLWRHSVRSKMTIKGSRSDKEGMTNAEWSTRFFKFVYLHVIVMWQELRANQIAPFDECMVHSFFI